MGTGCLVLGGPYGPGGLLWTNVLGNWCPREPCPRTHWSIGPLVPLLIGPLVECQMSNVKNQMSNVRCQKSIRFNFCRSVPPELLRSFLFFKGVRWLESGNCGPSHLLPDLKPAECDPKSKVPFATIFFGLVSYLVQEHWTAHGALKHSYIFCKALLP